MGNTKKLREKFTAFVNQLSPDECREQLVLAYLQMEKCCKALKGDNVEPVKMMDNGESSDLELFYRCKKVRKELDLLERDSSCRGSEGIRFGINVELVPLDVEFHDLDDEIREFFENNGKRFHVFLSETMNNNGTVPFETLFGLFRDLNGEAGDKEESRFKKGDGVWYMYGDKVQYSVIDYPMKDKDGTVIYRTKSGHNTAECETFGTMDDLLDYLKDNANEG